MKNIRLHWHTLISGYSATKNQRNSRISYLFKLNRYSITFCNIVIFHIGTNFINNHLIIPPKINDLIYSSQMSQSLNSIYSCNNNHLFNWTYFIDIQINKNFLPFYSFFIILIRILPYFIQNSILIVPCKINSLMFTLQLCPLSIRNFPIHTK